MSSSNVKVMGDERGKIPGLKIEHFLDKVTGNVRAYYMLNDVIIPKISITGKMAEQLSGLGMINKDLVNSKKWMQKAIDIFSDSDVDLGGEVNFVHAKDRDRFDDAKALFVAALTFYGKAFTEAAGRGTQLKRDLLDIEFRELHDYYMGLRHNFAAHSGDMRIEQASSSILLVPQSKNKYYFNVTTTRMQPDLSLEKEAELGFLMLIDHALSVVNKRYQGVSARILEAAAKRPLVFWLAAAQGDVLVDMDDKKNNNKKRRN